MHCVGYMYVPAEPRCLQLVGNRDSCDMMQVLAPRLDDRCLRRAGRGGEESTIEAVEEDAGAGAGGRWGLRCRMSAC